VESNGHHVDPDWADASDGDREPTVRTIPLRIAIGEHAHQSGPCPVSQGNETSVPLTRT